MNERTDYLTRAHREELLERIAHVMREDGTAEPIAGLYLIRVSEPNVRVHSVSVPSFCVIAQGGKEIALGASRHGYDPEH